MYRFSQTDTGVAEHQFRDKYNYGRSKADVAERSKESTRFGRECTKIVLNICADGAIFRGIFFVQF